MTVAKVYPAIAAVSAALATRGIAKNQSNVDGGYQFRGIDDVYNQLSPILAEHRLCVLPRILERQCSERAGVDGALLISVTVKAAFELVSADDGSRHVVETYGEALDGGDKGTSKAMTAAYKYALFQTFCIPVVGHSDADADTYQLKQANAALEPIQGWARWCTDIEEVVRSCETGDALDRLQSTNRSLLRSLADARVDLYERLGQTIRARRAEVASQRSGAPPLAPHRKKAGRTSRGKEEVVDA